MPDLLDLTQSGRKTASHFFSNCSRALSSIVRNQAAHPGQQNTYCDWGLTLVLCPATEVYQCRRCLAAVPFLMFQKTKLPDRPTEIDLDQLA
jgi:hypothetical protein